MTRYDKILFSMVVLVFMGACCAMPFRFQPKEAETLKDRIYAPPVAEAAEDVQELDVEVVAEGDYWYRSSLIRIYVVLVNNNTPCLAKTGHIEACDFENGLESPLLDGFR